MKRPSLKKELLEALSIKGERVATEFLKQNPEIIVYSFTNLPGHTCHVLNEFPLGSEFRADFVLIRSDSSGFDVYFVELENTDDIIITKSGLPSKRLNQAISQIGDWQKYVIKNESYLRKELTRWCLEKDLLKWKKTSSKLRNECGHELKDTDTYLRFYYHIIIGRRKEAEKNNKRDKMNQYSRMNSIKINAFDKFIDVADNFDRLNNTNAQVKLSETKEN